MSLTSNCTYIIMMSSRFHEVFNIYDNAQAMGVGCRQWVEILFIKIWNL